VVIITAQDYMLISGATVGGNNMWNLIKSWYHEYVECMNNAHLLDEAYMELNMDEEFGHGEW
jgi:hypothetical protein